MSQTLRDQLSPGMHWCYSQDYSNVEEAGLDFFFFFKLINVVGSKLRAQPNQTPEFLTQKF